MDNRVDKRGQGLYDRRKSLIYKGTQPIDQKMGSLRTPTYPCPRWTIVWITLNKPCMAVASH